MRGRLNFRISGDGSPETPYHVDGDVEDGLAAIAANIFGSDRPEESAMFDKPIIFDRPVIIDTPAGILKVKMRKAGSGQGQVVFETTPVLTSRQDMLVQYASMIASFFTIQHVVREIRSDLDQKLIKR